MVDEDEDRVVDRLWINFMLIMGGQIYDDFGYGMMLVVSVYVDSKYILSWYVEIVMLYVIGDCIVKILLLLFGVKEGKFFDCLICGKRVFFI